MAVRLCLLNAENAIAKVDNVGIGPIRVFVTPDNWYLLVANQGTTDTPSTTVSIIDTAKVAVVQTVDTGKGAHGVTIDSYGRHAYITNIYENDVVILDLAEQRIVTTIPVGAEPNGISFAPGALAQAPTLEISLPMPHQALHHQKTGSKPMLEFWFKRRTRMKKTQFTEEQIAYALHEVRWERL